MQIRSSEHQNKLTQTVAVANGDNDPFEKRPENTDALASTVPEKQQKHNVIIVDNISPAAAPHSKLPHSFQSQRATPTAFRRPIIAVEGSSVAGGRES